jgi:hypothetical protein
MFIRLTSLVLSTIIFAQISTAQSTGIRRPPMGTLTVMVMDITGKPVSGAHILLETNHAALEFATDQEGKYEIMLPADLYQVSIISSKEFCWSRRAAFNLKPSNTTSLKFILIEYQSVVPEGSERELGEEFLDTAGLNIQYESVPLTRLKSTVPELGVQFGERIERKGYIEYRARLLYSGSSLFGDPHPGVVASYDITTIYANVLRFNKNAFSLEAEGNVIIDDGKQLIRGKRAKLKFSSSTPVLELIK